MWLIEQDRSFQRYLAHDVFDYDIRASATKMPPFLDRGSYRLDYRTAGLRPVQSDEALISAAAHIFAKSNGPMGSLSFNIYEREFNPPPGMPLRGKRLYLHATGKAELVKRCLQFEEALFNPPVRDTSLEPTPTASEK